MCPWRITARAVERFQALVPQASRDFDEARAELVGLAAGVWERYERNPDLKPAITRTGAYQYRGPLPLRLAVVVAMNRAPESPALVDVVGAELGNADKRPRAGQKDWRRPSRA